MRIQRRYYKKIKLLKYDHISNFNKAQDKKKCVSSRIEINFFYSKSKLRQDLQSKWMFIYGRLIWFIDFCDHDFTFFSFEWQWKAILDAQNVKSPIV